MQARHYFDKISRWSVTLVGYGILLAFAFIFLFLIWQVWPLFQAGSISPVASPDAEPEWHSLYQADTGQQAELHLDNGLQERVVLQRDGAIRWYLQQDESWQLQLRDQLTMAPLSDAVLLPGSRTLLLADGSAQVQSWFRLHQQLIARPGISVSDTPLLALIPVSSSSFFSLHPGLLQLHQVDSARLLAELRLPSDRLQQLQLSDDRQWLRLDWQSGTSNWYQIQWQHPSVSFTQLWLPVHYEGRREPAYVWQTAAAADDASPKLSLVPLTIGTLKAAWYAMLFATPLAILAAVYTACYLPERWRYRVKASMEMLESMPTVILGFIAAFLLAPWLEQQLLLFFMLLLLVPSLVLLSSAVWYCWRQQRQQQAEQPGWFVLLIPLLLAVWLAYIGTPWLEQWWFDGSLLLWLGERGIDYQQRNALIIGMAMGLAVIPSIFSLTEDVVSQVPPSLAQGVLALGASRWQALSSMVLPVAAPGILAAVLLGLGRALGETMILIMATGNTPLLGFDPFTGMRSLTASLSLEMPEAAVSSSHFKVLLLAALLLLVLTFFINTLVSVLRQRIRQRYQQL